LAVEPGYDARRLVEHPTPFEPTECCNLTRKGSSIDGFLKKEVANSVSFSILAASFALYSAARLKRRAKDAVAL
jgi:hypothetical protein